MLLRAVSFVLLAAGPLQAQADKLFGTWRGAGEKNAGESVEFRADGMRFDNGPTLRWTFVRKGELRVTGNAGPVDLRYRVFGDRLILQVAGEDRLYLRISRAPAAPPGALWSHPAGWFAFEMPPGWSVWRELDDGILLNPGLKETDTLDALILVNRSLLDQEERGLEVAELVRRGESKLREQLAEQGIQVGQADKAPRPLRVGTLPAATQSWRGRAQSGASVEVWLAALLEKDASLSVLAVFVGGKGERFRPQVERLFQSLRAGAEEKAPAALAGRTFSHSEFFPGSGSFHTIYEFRSNGTVRKQMIISGGVGGNTEEVGRYEVSGDQVTLRFQDGTSSGRIVQEGGALRLGNTLYKAR